MLISSRTKINFLKDCNTTYTTVDQISNKLAKSFSDVSSTNNYSNIFRQHKIQIEQASLDLNDYNNERYNAPFSIRELKYALSKTADTFPDKMEYKMMKINPKTPKNIYLQYIINFQ